MAEYRVVLELELEADSVLDAAKKAEEMTEQFVTYKIAKELKELGFNDMCIATFADENDFELQDFGQNYDTFPSHIVAAPIWQQAYWFLLKKFEEVSGFKAFAWPFTHDENEYLKVINSCQNKK